MDHINFERYDVIHNEIMKRLQEGEITIEQAKEVNDLAFDKYIVEAELTIQDKILELRSRFESVTGKLLNTIDDISHKMDSDEKTEYSDLKSRYDKFSSKLQILEYTNYDEFLKEYNKLHSDIAEFGQTIRNKK